MKKVLLVYYSRSGHTEKIVESLGKILDADTEKIIDLKNRKGLLGFLSGGKDASMKKLTPITPVKFSAKEYELIVIATPIWANTVTPAIRTYIHQNKNNIAKAAFLVTQGGECNGKIFKDLEDLIGTTPIAAIDFSRKVLNSNQWQSKLKEFADSL